MNRSSTRAFLAYLRVSTARQETEGISLLEQRKAILDFARSRGFHIQAWHTEVESAAWAGRKVFNEVVSLLQKENGLGLLPR
jgi:DNA invertase Pin-like site-specific DNA recombinase